MGPVSTRPHFLPRIFLPMFGSSPGPRVETPGHHGQSLAGSLLAGGEFTRLRRRRGRPGIFWAGRFSQPSQGRRIHQRGRAKKELAKKRRNRWEGNPLSKLLLGKAGPMIGLFLPPIPPPAGKLFAQRIGGLGPSPNQAGGLGFYSSVPIPLSGRALLLFILKQSSENIVTRSSNR